jgi:hypothetical protein
MTTSTTNDGVELEYHGRRGEGFEHEKRCARRLHTSAELMGKAAG